MRKPNLKTSFQELIEFCFHHNIWKKKKSLFDTVMADLTNSSLPWNYDNLWHPSRSYCVLLYSDGVVIRTSPPTAGYSYEVKFNRRLSWKIVKFVTATIEHKALFSVHALAEKATNDYIKNTL